MGFFSKLFGGEPESPPSPTPVVKNEAKPVSIMPTNEEQYQRHVMRSIRLFAAMEKAHAQNNSERVASLRAELVRRQGACAAMNVELPNSVAELERIVKERGW